MVRAVRRKHGRSIVSSMPARDDLPGTLERSPKKARETWLKTHDAAVEQYGEGERAHRTAFKSLKRSFEKVDDHWEPKARPGPSDPQSAQRGRATIERPKATYGGVDVLGHTRDELLARARDLEIRGRSRMTKAELGEAIARKQG
jgi:hypothetical protein